MTRRVGKKELLKIIDEVVIFSLTTSHAIFQHKRRFYLKYLASKKVKSLELESHLDSTMVVLMVQPS